MDGARASSSLNVEFIRLFFRSPVHEEIAVRWARRLAELLGPRSSQLRPETTLAELMQWAVEGRVNSIDFALVFEPEMRREFSLFLDDAEYVTFREMVDYISRWYGEPT